MGTNDPNDAAARKLYDHQSTPAPTKPATIIAGHVATTPTPETALYGGKVLQQHINKLFADHLVSAPGTSTTVEQAKEGRFWADIGQRTGFPDALVMDLAEASYRTRQAATSVADDPAAADAALKHQVSGWNSESVERLRLTYGPQRGEELLHRTQRFIKQFPSLVERFSERGLGSRPDIVAAVAAHVHSTGWR